MLWIGLVLSLSLTAGAVDAKKIAGHRLALDDQGRLEIDGPVRFGVVGNTRGLHPVLDKGRFGHGEVTKQVVGDMTVAAMRDDLRFVIHTGDMVRTSSVGEWKRFDATFAALLDGSTPPPSPIRRIPAVPVTGDRDREKDDEARGLEAAFPGSGADIGFGRVASWQWFDVASGDSTWRFLVLDSGKQAMGSRWNEQLAWIPRAIQGQYTGILVFVHDPAVTLADPDASSAATAELLDVIGSTAPLLSVKAVFSGGPRVSEAILSEGDFGPLHVGAGGGGAPAHDIARVRRVERDRTALAGPFDAALLKAVDTHLSDEEPPPERFFDRAKGAGSFDGYDGFVEARHTPTYGWWLVGLDGPTVTVSWRAWQSDGTFTTAARLNWTRENGWAGGTD